MTHVTTAPIGLDHLLAQVAGRERGGTCVFLGTVRSGAEEGTVVAIEYSAYEAMVEAEAGRLLAEVEARWPDARVALQHRVGRVAVGEASVAVVAAAPHRARAFEVCRFVIDELKRRLPIWKKELHVDGTGTWMDSAGRPVAASAVPPRA